MLILSLIYLILVIRIEDLLLIAKENCSNTVFIETYKEIEDKIDEICKFDKIGIMAGASTPKKSIDDVINLLNSQKIHKS